MTVDLKDLREAARKYNKRGADTPSTVVASDDDFESHEDAVAGEMFSDVFGYTPEGMDDFHLPLMNGRAPIDSKRFYIPDREVVSKIALAFKLGLKALMVGPPGCGKTEMATYIADHLGLPMFRFNFREDMTPDEVVGKVEVVNEGGVPVTKGVEADFIKAFQRPGVILADEIMRAHPATLMVLQPGWERDGEIRLQHVAGDVTVKRHPECYILMADNTHGTGDNMDKYVSNQQDQSFLNRIEMTIKCDYAPRHVEAQMVKHWAPNISDNIADKMVEIGQRMRGLWNTGEISMPFTPRTLNTYSQIAAVVKNPVQAFNIAYTDSLPDDDEKRVARDAVALIFGSSYT